MSTSKQRFHVTFDSDIHHQIIYLAKKQGKSYSQVIQDLTAKALEYDDDAYLCRIVEENERKSNGKTLSMEEFWKKNDARVEEEYE